MQVGEDKMSYPINYPTPQNANVQIFTQVNVGVTAHGNNSTWIKPQGASFVWFTLIGAGGNGDGTTGGGSGAVTNFMCPAFLIPDQLQVRVASTSSGANTNIYYQQKDSIGYTLLDASSANGIVGGGASSGNYFTAMGFFQSVAGESGFGGGAGASPTTFLSGGAGTSNTVTANYGYTNTTNNQSGYFMLQPIIVGVSGIGTASGGIGCGGGAVTGRGGNGMVVIITW